MPNYTVYALASSKKDWIYVGLTNNLTRRLGEHNSGKTKSTEPFRPLKLVYYEVLPDRSTARIREKQLKSSAGKRFIRTLL